MVGRQPTLDYIVPTSSGALSSIGAASVVADLGNGFIEERNRNTCMERALTDASTGFGTGTIDGAAGIEAPLRVQNCANHVGGSFICACAKCTRLAGRSYEARRKREYRRKLKECQNQDPSCLIIAKRQKIAKHIVNCFKKYTKGLDNHVKESIIKDVLKDGCMRGLKIQMPEDSVMLGFRNTLATIKKPKSNKELFLKRGTIIMPMRAPVLNISLASKLLGTHRRNFYAAREKLKKESLPLHLCKRQECTKDAISDEVKELVVSFWTENTRVSPNKKDVCQMCSRCGGTA